MCEVRLLAGMFLIPTIGIVFSAVWMLGYSQGSQHSTIDGDTAASPETRAPENPMIDEPNGPSPLPYRVVATSLANRAEWSTAVLINMTTGETGTYFVGDRLGADRIRRIERMRVFVKGKDGIESIEAATDLTQRQITPTRSVRDEQANHLLFRIPSRLGEPIELALDGGRSCLRVEPDVA